MHQAKGETIARLVGHSRVTTTDGYLHIQNATLEKAVHIWLGNPPLRGCAKES